MKELAHLVEESIAKAEREGAELGLRRGLRFLPSLSSSLESERLRAPLLCTALSVQLLREERR